MRVAGLLLLLVVGAGAARGEDWAAYRIVSASVPDLVLDAAVGADGLSREGSVVAVQRAGDGANQKWLVEPAAAGWCRLRPLSGPGLALAAVDGQTRNGTPVVLGPTRESDAQLWSLTRQDDGSYTLVAKHAPGQGLDHFAGNPEPGARVDLWTNAPGDRHLRWFIRPLAGSGPPAAEAAPRYAAPDVRPEDVREGAIKTLRFTESRVYPGTVREVTVFVPAQYDAARAACVYVKTDGYNPREKQLLETMIATREIPVTVGVFVRPGTLPAPMAGTADRRNRDLEYDAVNGDNARFLDEELLPFVARECGLRLSGDGNDRCIAGGSSGGIAAFTAAWHRPESFSRVYAASGSWVAFRGGHEFPTMVRKFEPRPIRAFLTTGTRDMENAAGDWFLADQEMAKALAFSGYDHRFRIIDGGHVVGYLEHWREAMAYLWADWPRPVARGAGPPRAREILVAGEDWTLVAEGFRSTRGPAANAAGEVYFADTSANRLHRIGIDGDVTTFAADADAAHCVTVGADGAVYTVSERSGRLLRYDAAGNASLVLEGLCGHSILARPDGGLYVTSNDDGDARDGGSVWLVRDGTKTRVDAGIRFATGMAVRPDQWLLSVAEGRSKWLWSHQIAADGTLVNKERFFHLHVADQDDDAGAECLCASREGRQFIATRSGIQVTADDGPTQVILTVPGRGRVTGVAIGGKDLDVLYAFCTDRIWKRRIQQHAFGAWSPWTKVTPDKL